MTTYFTSDLHFDHKNICKFTDRQLVVDQDHHTEWLIDIWNTTVKNSDRIFHLGDFSFATKYDEIASVVKKLQGQKFFIKGNHDRSKVLEQLKSDNLIQNWHHYEEIKEYMQQREIYVADQHRSIKAQLDKADKKYYSLQNLSSEK